LRNEAKKDLLPSCGGELIGEVEAHRTLVLLVEESRSGEVLLGDDDFPLTLVTSVEIFENRDHDVDRRLLASEEHESEVALLEDRVFQGRVDNGDVVAISELSIEA